MTTEKSTGSKIIEKFKEYLEENDFTEDIAEEIKKKIDEDTMDRDEIIETIKEAENHEVTES